MANPSKPGSSLLDNLRAQSSAARAQGEAARKPVEEALAEIDRLLWRAFRWLDEAVGHLEIIKPQVRHRFAIPGVVTIEQPHYERGFMSYRRRPLAGQDLLAQIELFYRLIGPQPIIVKVHPGTALSIEDRLRPSSLPYQYVTEMDENRVVRFGVFHITPAISANVRFEPDYHRQIIEVVLRNVDRFEAVSLEFQPEKLDEPALEDLVKLLLGEANTFLRRAPLAGFRARPTPPPSQPVNGAQVYNGAPTTMMRRP